MWEALQILNSLYALTLVGSLLSMLTLRIVTGNTSQQINLIGEYRTAGAQSDPKVQGVTYTDFLDLD